MTPEIEDGLVARIAEIAVAAQMRVMEESAASIRREILLAVHAEFAGDQVYIGKGTAKRNRERDQAIRADRATGLSIRALAQKYHLSKSGIARILGGPE